MTYDQLIDYYKTQEAAAAAVGRSQERMSFWKKNGIPIERQCQYEILTGGALKADRKVLKQAAK